MALVACIACGQPFYASCHDASCIDAVCPLCEYGPPDGAPAHEVAEQHSRHEVAEQHSRREDASHCGDARPCSCEADTTGRFHKARGLESRECHSGVT